MRDYNEVLNSGDNAPNLKGGLESNLIRMLHREEIEAGGPMPPTKPLKEEWIDYFERWVQAGMPETAEDLPVTEPAETETPATETP
jgi:hypothetical protein